MKYSVAGIRVNVRDVNASNREWITDVFIPKCKLLLDEILTRSRSRLHVVTWPYLLVSGHYYCDIRCITSWTEVRVCRWWLRFQTCKRHRSTVSITIQLSRSLIDLLRYRILIVEERLFTFPHFFNTITIQQSRCKGHFCSFIAQRGCKHILSDYRSVVGLAIFKLH